MWSCGWLLKGPRALILAQAGLEGSGGTAVSGSGGRQWRSSRKRLPGPHGTGTAIRPPGAVQRGECGGSWSPSERLWGSWRLLFSHHLHFADVCVLFCFVFLIHLAVALFIIVVRGGERTHSQLAAEVQGRQGRGKGQPRSRGKGKRRALARCAGHRRGRFRGASRPPPLGSALAL